MKRNNIKNNNNKNKDNNEIKNINKNINIDSEKTFKNIAHIITIEGSTPSAFFSYLKELIIIGEDNNIRYEVIDPIQFFNFLEIKNIPITDKEKNEIKKEYGIKIGDDYQYLDYDKIEEKIFDHIKDDKNISI